MTDDAPIHDPAALTRHIETRYHASHRRQLPQLLRLAEMIEDLHEPDRGVPAGLAAILHRMIAEMEVHMKKEELMVFPLIRKGGGPVPGARIAAMREQIMEAIWVAAEMRAGAAYAHSIKALELMDGDAPT
ncbi:hemerythrin domain-containing protein [Oceanibium sediminis]|uniref:hemerythrin domain-containing protein n=1 Tax=Oceanibium sediminis TaxID=2026339 RepID=UPI000DD31013|nr:hemerythrin domain-containing protein [Oceanibium sediminis]